MGNTLFTLSHLFLKVILKNNHRYFDVNLQLKSQARKRKIASPGSCSKVWSGYSNLESWHQKYCEATKNAW